MTLLGQKVRDRVSGFEGTVLEQNERLYSNTQLFVVPHRLTDGKPVSGMWFEVSRVELVENEARMGFVTPAEVQAEHVVY